MPVLKKAQRVSGQLSILQLGLRVGFGPRTARNMSFALLPNLLGKFFYKPVAVRGPAEAMTAQCLDLSSNRACWA